MKVGQELRVIAIATLVAHVIGCGEVSVNGLRDGEKRVAEAPLEIPPAEKEAEKDPPGVRTFKGEISGEVTIHARERVVFVAERDANAVDKIPTFLGPVTVGFGASLIGAANFPGGLTVKGEREAPVLWRLDETVAMTASNPQLEWVSLWGGAIELTGQSSWVSALRHCRLEGVRLRFPEVAGGKIEIVWSNFINVDLTVELPTQNVPSEPAPIPEYLRISSNQFKLSTLRMREPVVNYRLFWIEANNFEDLAEGSFYFELFSDERLGDRLGSMARSNYFVNKQKLAPGRPGVYMAYDEDWVRGGFPVGQDGDIFRGATDDYDDRAVYLKDVTLDPANARFYAPGEWGIYGSSLGWWATRFLRQELQNYGSKRRQDDFIAKVAFKLSNFQGCELQSPNDWGYANYECAGSLKMDLEVGIPTMPSPPTPLKLTVTFDRITYAHAERRLREALVEALGRFVDNGVLDQVPTYTPYF